MPTDMRRYPGNWASEIRPRILARAGNRCEWCGVPNGAIGWRLADGAFRDLDVGPPPSSDEKKAGARSVRIVLTVAHINDPDPMNVEPGNLAALCQRCHNRHDAPMRREHASETRRRRKLAAGQEQLL